MRSWRETAFSPRATVRPEMSQEQPSLAWGRLPAGQETQRQIPRSIAPPRVFQCQHMERSDKHANQHGKNCLSPTIGRHAYVALPTRRWVGSLKENREAISVMGTHGTALLWLSAPLSRARGRNLCGMLHAVFRLSHGKPSGRGRAIYFGTALALVKNGRHKASLEYFSILSTFVDTEVTTRKRLIIPIIMSKASQWPLV